MISQYAIHSWIVLSKSFSQEPALHFRGFHFQDSPISISPFKPTASPKSPQKEQEAYIQLRCGDDCDLPSSAVDEKVRHCYTPKISC